MKRLKVFSAAALAFCLSSSNALAQARSIDGNGFDSGGVKIIPKNSPEKAVKSVKTVQLVAVSPERVWKSADKKKNPIIGSLLAFEREEKTGKIAMIRDEKVRLLVGKKPFLLPLSKLSADDQTYIRKLEDAAREAGKLLEPKKTETSAKKKTEAKKATEKTKASESE